MATRSVTVADLENNLGRVLGRVRRGEEIEVRDENMPIAKIVPIAEIKGGDSLEAALVAAGKLRPPKGPVPASIWRTRGARGTSEAILEALRADRDGR